MKGNHQIGKIKPIFSLFLPPIIEYIKFIRHRSQEIHRRWRYRYKRQRDQREKGETLAISEFLEDRSASSDVQKSMHHTATAHWTVWYYLISVFWVGIIFTFTVHSRKFPEFNYSSVLWLTVSFSDRSNTCKFGRSIEQVEPTQSNQSWSWSSWQKHGTQVTIKAALFTPPTQL